MRILEALKILEDATLECQAREIDTPEAREALDVVEKYVDPPWTVEAFRRHLVSDTPALVAREGQQQMLRVSFGGIHRSIRALLQETIRKMRIRIATSPNDDATQAKLDELVAQLAKMPERWEFRAR